MVLGSSRPVSLRGGIGFIFNDSCKSILAVYFVNTQSVPECSGIKKID